MKEKFWSEERELREVEDEDAAGFANGSVRGLFSEPSPCERGLGDGEGRECAMFDGEGGSRSVIPKRCSDVNEGI